jgi:hypothetical protein
VRSFRLFLVVVRVIDPGTGLVTGYRLLDFVSTLRIHGGYVADDNDYLGVEPADSENAFEAANGMQVHVACQGCRAANATCGDRADGIRRVCGSCAVSQNVGHKRIHGGCDSDQCSTPDATAEFVLPSAEDNDDGGEGNGGDEDGECSLTLRHLEDERRSAQLHVDILSSFLSSLSTVSHAAGKKVKARSGGGPASKK